MIRLRLANFLRPGDACHYARVSIRQPQPDRMHRHDFLEVFWMAEGEGTHWVNGRPRPLQPGRLTLIRASDAHAFSGNLCLVNVAFGVPTWEYLRRRYGLARLFAPAPLAAREHALPPLALREVEAIAAELAAGVRGRLAAERFLLNLFQLLHRQEQAVGPAARPAWLTEALGKIGAAPHFQPGPRGLGPVNTIACVG